MPLPLTDIRWQSTRPPRRKDINCSIEDLWLGTNFFGAVLIFRITLIFPWHLSFCWPTSYSSVLNYVCPPQFTRVNLTRLLLSKLYQLCIVIHPVRHRCKCPSTVDVHETASDRRTCSNNGDGLLLPCLPVKLAHYLSLRCSIELQILIPDTELQWFVTTLNP